jgi:hypothetical protein
VQNNAPLRTLLTLQETKQEIATGFIMIFPKTSNASSRTVNGTSTRPIVNGNVSQIAVVHQVKLYPFHVSSHAKTLVTSPIK